MQTLSQKAQNQIKNDDQYIKHIQIVHWMRQKITVFSIFSISEESQILRIFEDATLILLKTRMESNLETRTVEFKTGGRVKF